MAVIDVWETSGLSEKHRPWVEEIIKNATFPWERLLPEIRRQRGSDNIPVYSLDLSRFKSQLEKDEHHIHDEEGNHGHIVKVRNAVLGVFWLDGRIGIEQSIDDKELVQEVFMAEAAHSIDYFLPLTDDQKLQIMKLFHPEGPDQHTWWEVQDYGKEYYSLVGESFMALCCHAYTDLTPWQNSFHHKATEEMKHDVYRILGVWPEGEEPVEPIVDPILLYKLKCGKKAHTRNCRYIRVAEKFNRLVIEVSLSEAKEIGLTVHTCTKKDPRLGAIWGP